MPIWLFLVVVFATLAAVVWLAHASASDGKGVPLSDEDRAELSRRQW